MREILFLAHRMPYPPDRGDKIRSWHILRALAALAPVHVVALVDDPRDLAHRGVLEALCASVTLVPHRVSKLSAMARALISGQPASVAALGSAVAQHAVDQLLATRPISTIFAFSGQMAQFVRAPIGNRRFVMDFVDVDSEKFLGYAEQARGISAFANRFEGQRLAAFERSVAQRADVSLFVSPAEAALFRARSGLARARIEPLENGIDLARFDPAIDYPAVPVDGPLIVFTGQMDYRPNIEAVDDFARQALPRIRARFADAQFAIVGRAPTAEVMALAALPGVCVTGEVDDTRQWLAAAKVVVAPLRLARGIQNKILEAMAMARPVVASRAAAEGIDASAGVELLVADGAIDQADAVIGLIADPAQARMIGAAAHARMHARYGWDAQLAGLAALTSNRASVAA